MRTAKVLLIAEDDPDEARQRFAVAMPALTTFVETTRKNFQANRNTFDARVRNFVDEAIQRMLAMDEDVIIVKSSLDEELGLVLDYGYFDPYTECCILDAFCGQKMHLGIVSSVVRGKVEIWEHGYLIFNLNELRIGTLVFPPHEEFIPAPRLSPQRAQELFALL